jgi:hypothetical protein
MRGLVAKQRILEVKSKTRRKKRPFTTKETPCQISVFGDGLHVQLLYTQSSLAQKHPNLFLESTVPYSLPCLLRRRVLSTQSFLPREKKAMTTATLRYRSDHRTPHPTFRGRVTYARTTTTGHISNYSIIVSIGRGTYSRAKSQWECSSFRCGCAGKQCGLLYRQLRSCRVVVQPIGLPPCSCFYRHH